MMDTYYAKAKRSSKEKLESEIDVVNNSPIVSGLLYSMSGLLAILNENRQIISINDALLQMLGVNDPKEVIGLRQGEAIHCIHASKAPSGCGTTKFCSSCGAAIAMVTSLKENRPVERKCMLTTYRDDKQIDIALLVKSHPITVRNKKFLLLYLQDITQEQQRAALERTFFHDINNMLMVLVGTSNLLLKSAPSTLAKTIHQTSLRLSKEVDIQRYLSCSEASDFTPTLVDVTTTEIMKELKTSFSQHPLAHEKYIEITDDYPHMTLKTDSSLLLRILWNMITNALEATEIRGTVKIWLEHKKNAISFCVWNATAIPSEIINRVFQRNFSSKSESGRGVGTFSMKLLGEGILGGKVAFTTSEEEGTIFTFKHMV